jgi:hypothetical protein
MGQPFIKKRRSYRNAAKINHMPEIKQSGSWEDMAMHGYLEEIQESCI